MSIDFEKFKKLGREAGLSKNETKVYLANLELGPAPVQNVARKAGLSRVATYTIIDALIKKGLVSWFAKGKRRYSSVENPDKLLYLIKQKERKLSEERAKVRKSLPELKTYYRLAGKGPEVRFYEGVEGLKAIYEDTLNTKEDLLVYSDIAATEKLIPDRKFWDDYVKKRVKLGIKAKGIGPRSPEAEAVAGKNREELRKTRFLPKDESFGPTELYIYGDKIAMLSFEREIVGVVIENKELSETQRRIYMRLWNSIK